MADQITAFPNALDRANFSEGATGEMPVTPERDLGGREFRSASGRANGQDFAESTGMPVAGFGLKQKTSESTSQL